MPAKSPQPLMKDGLGREAAQRLRSAFEQIDPSFDGQQFQRQVMRGLAQLELKARVNHFIQCLDRQLPTDYLAALDTVVAAGDMLRNDGQSTAQNFFAPWPVVDWVGSRGVDKAEASLAALRQLTSVFSAEFAVRPFILADSKATLAVFSTWLDDSDHHVRRLVSEGTRPLLPWGVQLPVFREDPKPALALLESLKDDESEYVRRSVANHLNDVAKDHPRITTDLARDWWQGASDERKALVKHGLRTLIKKGDPRALSVLGFTTKPNINAKLALAHGRLRVGGTQEISLQLVSTGKKKQKLVVDYAVHHQRAAGRVSAKVFKWKNVEVAPGETLSLQKNHAFVPRSVRRLYPGTHKIEVLVSGQPMGSVEFELVK
ncbi:MAG: 3-methyladenine DNA glycosylase AlkC [Candidatus Krumholzibacteriia bacterium]|jgi:3-methyladenine DNA glycosylase AlkC